MRRYRFALEPVLRVRRIEQDGARAALVAAQQQLAAADAALVSSMERYEAIPARTGPEDATRWLARRSIADRTAASVLAASVTTDLARTRTEEQRRVLHDARMRTSAIERLDERRREEHELGARRAEDAEVDELVTARHGRDER